MKRVPLWIWLGWLLALLCVAGMVRETAMQRPVLPARARAPPARR